MLYIIATPRYAKCTFRYTYLVTTYLIFGIVGY